MSSSQGRLFLLFLLFFIQLQHDSALLRSERDILEEFFYATRGNETWVHTNGWTSLNTPVCEWYGVHCLRDSVVALELPNNGLMVETIPSSLYQLTALQRLLLSGNRIQSASFFVDSVKLQEFHCHGCSLRDLQHLPRTLRRLLVSQNQLTQLPDTLRQLTLLQELQLSQNPLSTSSTSLAAVLDWPSMTALTSLQMTDARLIGTIPTAIWSLPRLQSLILSQNSLQGTLPPWLQMPHLHTLLLTQNQLTGSLPSLAMSPSLTQVSFAHNHLQGTLPLHFLTIDDADDSKTIQIQLQNNSLSGTLPELWAETNVALFLDLTNNIELQPPVPKDWCLQHNWMNGLVGLYGCDAILCPKGTWNSVGRQTSASNPCVPCVLSQSADRMGATDCGGGGGGGGGGAAVDSNDTTSIGSILAQLYWATDGPHWKNAVGWSQIGEFSQVQYDSLDFCSFFGIVCTRDKSKIELIGLANNGLVGTVPVEFWTLPGLQAVDLSSNQIQIMALDKAPALRRLRLSHTTVSTFQGMDQLQQLRELFLDGCELRQNFTQGVKLLPKSLQSLHLQSSQLQGTIPSELGRRLTNLRHLYLNANDLTGTLPTTIGWLLELQTLDLSDNAMASTLPAEWNDLRSLQTCRLNRMGLQGPLPAWQDMAALEQFEAMGNALSGPLPNNFLGKRLSDTPLTVRLTSNQLTGSIPSSFLNFRRLHMELMDNQITFIDQAFCAQREWMSGQVGQWLDANGPTANGCDAILCPSKTYNTDGRVVDSTKPCLVCPNNKYMGETVCEVNVTENREVQILNQLYLATGGNDWNATHVNWTKPGVPVCYREGVVCGWPTPEMNSGVTELRLNAFGLRGTILSSIFELPRLRALDVSLNAVDVDFHGVERASILEIVKATNTRVRSLKGLEKAGPLLHELRWDMNSVEGPLPIDILSQLTSLRRLYLSDNRFTGTLPPELFQSLTNLVTLSIHDNPRLAGPLPTTLGLLTGLEVLDAHACSWSGPLPTQLELLTDLQRLTLSENSLEGPLLAFPSSVELKELYLSRNQFTGHTPPNLLDSVSMTEPMLRVDFAFNKVTGSIPSQLLRFQHLNLDIVGNELTSLLDVCNHESDGPRDVIPKGWMNGAVAVASSACDAIACRPGFTSLYGRVMNSNNTTACQPCPESDAAPFYGSIYCLDMTAQRERRALVAFYEATQGSTSWITNTHWLSDDDPVCNWYGVLCDKQQKHVVQLRLENNGLRSVEQLVDVVQILSEGLPHLEELDLKGNDELNLRFTHVANNWPLQILAVSATNLTSLQGVDRLSRTLSTLLAADNALQGEIPTELYSLTELRQLYLSYNKFNGTLSSEIGFLSNLKSLYFSNNELSGSLPSELNKLNNLRHLILNDNALHGQLPTALSELSNLEQLWLQQQHGRNSLNGRLPSFANANQLWYLDLSDNDLSGSIPSIFLENSQRINQSVTLLLWNNDLTGTVPTSLTRFESLYIELGDNEITELPPVLCQNEQWMNGAVVPGNCDYFMCPPATYHPAGRQTSPDEPCRPCPAELTKTNVFWGRSYCQEIESAQEVLEQLYMSTNGKSWLNQTNWLSDQPICSWSGILCSGGQDDNDGVIGISLPDNLLQGTLSTQLWALPVLSNLSLQNNPELVVDFRGAKVLTGISSLQHLNVANTRLLHGLDGLVHFKELQSLTATHLTGTFPSELLELKQLEFLDLTNCHLIGTLPTFKPSEVPQWKQFYASFNEFHGSIPASWGHLSLLEELVLDGNYLSGSIPSSLANLPRLQTLSLTRKSTPGLKLSGHIPSFEQAPQLQNLHLAFNELSGSLPDAFLQSAIHIRSIDLSHNSLQGTLPSSLDLLPPNLNLFLEENQISGMPLELCDNENWMQGRVGEVGNCQAILCPPKTWAPLGRAADDKELCRPCDESFAATPYYGSTKCQAVADERSILLELYHATRGSDWVRHDFWNTPTDVCNWYGVACDARRRVILLNLEHNGLLGTVPSSLWRLPRLQYLNLGSNQLTVSFESLYLAEHLLDLRLSGAGRINVTGLARVSTLSVLDISSNGLGGPFPLDVLQVSNLRILKLHDNQLTGTIPSSFASLQHLRVLELHQNDFVGSVPAFAFSVVLHEINLSDNHLQGSLPADFLSHVPPFSSLLIHIQLSSNALTGALPEELVRFDSLHLQVGGNQISSFSSKLCEQVNWNHGAVAEYGCNGVLCPPKTWSPSGYHSLDDACRPCRSAADHWYGQDSCPTDSAAPRVQMFWLLSLSLCFGILLA